MYLTLNDQSNFLINLIKYDKNKFYSLKFEVD